MVDTFIMIATHIHALDLNLLVHLDALLAEAHVTRAARRVGLTQSAMSRSLARLRDALGDPLLVRGASGLVPTPRAVALAAPLRQHLGALDALIGDAPAFDPATARRGFTILMADYGALLLPPLLARIRAEAPGVDVVVLPSVERTGEDLERGEVDLALGPRLPSGAAIVWRRLYHEDFVVIARKGHPKLRRGVDAATFLALGHVSISPSGRPGSPVDDALARRGHTRRIAVRVPSFLVAPMVVASSDLIGLLPRSMALHAARSLPLGLHDAPLPFGGVTLELAWHERHRHDPAHAWFRALVEETAKARA